MGINPAGGTPCLTARGRALRKGRAAIWPGDQERLRSRRRAGKCYPRPRQVIATAAPTRKLSLGNSRRWRGRGTFEPRWSLQTGPRGGCGRQWRWRTPPLGVRVAEAVAVAKQKYPDITM